jgi:CheY-like chemotaxis protein
MPQVAGDAARLHQVVTNLVGNAIKFTPKRGRITLRARTRGDVAIVEVKDTGPGIPEANQQRIFEPYYRIGRDRESFGGLGLGLALCKTLIDLHGGHIWVRSHPGQGSKFAFSLPVQEVPESTPATAVVDKLWKVLMIEDEAEMVESVSRAFEMDWPEAKLVAAWLGEEGVDLVETEEPDVVLLDLGLPDMSGFEVLRLIRLFSSVPVIILSVKADEKDIFRALESGADDYMVKPFRPLELLARVRALHESGHSYAGRRLMVRTRCSHGAACCLTLPPIN